MKTNAQIDYIIQNENNSKQREESGLANPKISIIVPVYNVEQYLRCCLDSIVSQTFTDWECILIDDGSPDNSGKICDEYAQKDKRFRVIHQENKGISVVRNIGLDIAKGEWISFIDSDDWIEQIFLETLYQKAIEDRADIVGCNFLLETEKGKIVREEKYCNIGNFNLINNLLKNPMPGGLWCYLIKRSLFNDISFIEGINICEDLLVTIKLFAKKIHTAYIPAPLYHYNRLNTNTLVNCVFSKEKCQEIEQAMREIECFLKENNLYQQNIGGILEKKKILKLWILHKTSLRTGIDFYGLYPGLSKHINIYSISTLFNKVLLYNTEYKNIPFVWLLLGFEKIYLGIKSRFVN